jgi:hypothetical protein
VPPLPVIEYLDIFKAHGSHLCTSLITESVYPLVLETVEPAFGWGVPHPSSSLYDSLNRSCPVSQALSEMCGFRNGYFYPSGASILPLLFYNECRIKLILFSK